MAVVPPDHVDPLTAPAPGPTGEGERSSGGTFARLRSWGATNGRDVRIGLAGVATALFVMRLLGASWRSGFPLFFPDSSSYLAVARLGPLRGGFWFGERPIVVPALQWLLGRNLRLVVLAQVALHVGVAWWAIVATWRRCASGRVRWLGVLMLASLAIESRFALWSTQILSESVSMSLGAAALLGWLAFADRGGADRCRRAFLLTALWALCRDANLPIALLSTVPAALAMVRWDHGIGPGTRRALVRGSAAMIVVAGYVTVASSVSERTIYPTLNVIGQRVLPDPELTAFYVDWGMPFDSVVQARAGQSSFDEGFDMLNAPELAAFRDWADGRGQLVQLWSMVRFGPRFVGDVWDDLDAQLGTDHSSYDLFHASDRLPDRLPAGLDGPRSHGELGIWLTAALLGLGVIAMSRRRAIAVVLGIALAGSLLDLYMSWLGDSVEVQRHLVGAVARLGLVLVLSIVHGLDSLLTPARRRRRIAGRATP